jgi:hypothetical protein
MILYKSEKSKNDKKFLYKITNLKEKRRKEEEEEEEVRGREEVITPFPRPLLPSFFLPSPKID